MPADDPAGRARRFEPKPVAGGVLLYPVLNLPLGVVGVTADISTESTNRPELAALTVGSLVVVLSCAVLAWRHPRPGGRSVALGMVLGWALLSIVFAGACTGLNPELYGP